MLQIPFKTQTRQDVRKCEAGTPPPPFASPDKDIRLSVRLSHHVRSPPGCCKVNLYSQNTGVIARLRYEASVPH